jgi:tripartite-type tricarboxylate transporter receptor subunit TctC
VLTDILTVAEFVPGYEFSFWTGIGAPKNTPAAIVDKLNTEINAALADPKMKARACRVGPPPPFRAHPPTSVLIQLLAMTISGGVIGEGANVD